METLTKISTFLFLHPYCETILILCFLAWWTRKIGRILQSVVCLLEDLRERLYSVETSNKN